MYKKLIALLLLCNLWYGYGHTETDKNMECAEFIPIPDPNFEMALFNLGIDDMPGDGQVLMSMVMMVTDLNIANQGISDLAGIENFMGLQTLNASGNNLTNLNIDGLTQLMNVYINDNSLNVLLLNDNPSLQRLEANNNNLSLVMVQNISTLVELSVSNNNLTMLEVFNNMNLETLRVDGNMFMDLNIATLSNLKTLSARGNSLQSLPIDSLTNLEVLDVSDNQFTSIDLTNNTALRAVQLDNNSLTSANLKNGNNIDIVSIDLTGNSGLNCVFVDDTIYSTANWTNVDPQTLFTSTNYCRYTAIPDINFETALENLGYDDISGDGRVPTTLIEQVTSLNIGSRSISNITGIQDFIALTQLEAYNNPFTSIDVSTLISLEVLDLDSCPIHSLDVRNNLQLKSLDVEDGENLSNLNLNNNTLLEVLDANSAGLLDISLGNLTNLKNLYLGYNQLEFLDVSALTALEEVALSNNALEFVNIKNGNNTDILSGSFDARNNPNLSCILVDNTSYSNSNWTDIDATTSFSNTYCRYTTIPDANFEAKLGVLGYDNTPSDGRVPTALIENVQSILLANLSITDLTGIEDFTALQTLEIDFNNLIEIDLSLNSNLIYLDISRNSLTSLDLTANTMLATVIVTENDLTELDIRNGNNTDIFIFNARNNPNLACVFVDDASYSTTNWAQIDAQTQFSDTGYCRYTTIADANFEAALEALGYDDISGDGQVPTTLIETVDYLNVENKNIADATGIEDFAALDDLYINDNNLTSLDLSNNLALKYVFCRNNNLTAINFSTNTFLEHIDCSGNNITTIDIANNLLLESLDIGDNPIATLDITNNTGLEELYLTNTNIAVLDLSANTTVRELEMSDTPFESIDLSALSQLSVLFASNSNLTTLDLSNNAMLNELEANNTPLTFVNLKNGNNTSLDDVFLLNNSSLPCVLVDNATYSANNWTDIDNGISFSDTYCHYTAIPDPNFEAALDALGYDDISSDGQVPTALIENVLSLNVQSSSISDLTGIQDFTMLGSLRCTNNSLTSIDLSDNTNLKFLWCNQNSLTSLDLSNNAAIGFISASQNAITSFDGTGLTQVTTLSLWSNQITHMDLTNMTSLRVLELVDNSLSTLDVSTNVALEEINIRNNSVNSLDLSNNPALTTINVRSNGMSHLNVKNGNNTNITGFRANSNSNLACILVDDVAFSTTNWTHIDANTNFSLTYCRYITIPDINFEVYLEGLGYDDSTEDGQVPTALIEELTSLSIFSGNNISDITGIEAFTALEVLQVYENNITSINVDANTALKTLEINETPITSISVDNNPVLENILILDTGTIIPSLNLSNSPLLRDIDITNAGLQSIVLPELPNLEKLFMPNNNLTASIDVSASTVLQRVALQGNNLLDFNIKNGNNINILSIFLMNNPNLSCVLVDDVAYSTANWTGIDAQTSFSDTSCTDAFSLNIKVYLQGAALNPNIGEEDLMRDDLRVGGFLPTTSPYADGSTCEATVFDVTGNNAIVDWIWVELRDSSNNTTVSYARSALLQRDGDVVDVDGVSVLDFSTIEDTYYIAINHRSHLGIMSTSAITFTTGTTNTVNFMNFNDAVLFGGNPQTDFGMPVEVYGMWCGNSNSDAVVQYSGTSPDTPNILSEVLNDSGNFLNFPTYSVTGYNVNDINMDGVIQYSGTNPDTPFILQNVLAHPGNFLNFSTYQIIEQLPENIFN